MTNKYKVGQKVKNKYSGFIRHITKVTPKKISWKMGKTTGACSPESMRDWIIRFR